MTEKKREYLRLPVRVCFSYRLVSEDEKNSIIEEISKGSFYSGFEEIRSFARLIMEQHKLQETKEINPVILELLLIIMDKISRIEERVVECPVKFYQGKGETEDLSGGGFSFISSDKFSEGSLLDVFLEIKMFPKNGVRALGRVVRTEQVEKGIKHGVQFEFIREEDREDIIKYLFIKQRELLAKRRLERK